MQIIQKKTICNFSASCWTHKPKLFVKLALVADKECVLIVRLLVDEIVSVISFSRRFYTVGDDEVVSHFVAGCRDILAHDFGVRTKILNFFLKGHILYEMCHELPIDL